MLQPLSGLCMRGSSQSISPSVGKGELAKENFRLGFDREGDFSMCCSVFISDTMPLIFASARADPMMTRLSEERPVKVTYMEKPLLSPKEPCERLHIRRPSPDERRQARQEKSHGIIEGLLALAFCVLSTFFICAVASVLGFTQGRGTSELVAPLQKRTPERFTEKMAQKQAFLQRSTRVKGN